MPFVGRQTARYHVYTCTKTLGLTISAGRGARWGQRRWQCCSNSLLPFQINRKGASEAGRWPLRAIEGSLPKILGLFRKHWFVFQGASPDAYKRFIEWSPQFFPLLAATWDAANANCSLRRAYIKLRWAEEKAGKDDAKEEKVEKEASAANLQHQFQSPRFAVRVIL